MKKILCFFMVALLAALLVVPCFAAESTVDRGDPVDWFSGQVPVGYTIVRPSGTAITSSQFNALMSWFVAAGFNSSSNAIGDVTGSSNNAGNSTSTAWSNGVHISRGGSYDDFTSIYAINITMNSLVGYDEAAAIDGFTVEYVYGDGEGFVSSGFSTALTELSTIVSAILSNQYILIAIGLAVAVSLVAWGISKIKSLVKGY